MVLSSDSPGWLMQHPSLGRGCLVNAGDRKGSQMILKKSSRGSCPSQCIFKKKWCASLSANHTGWENGPGGLKCLPNTSILSVFSNIFPTLRFHYFPTTSFSTNFILSVKHNHHFHHQIYFRGVSVVAQRKHTWLVFMRTPVRSLALLSGLSVAVAVV